MNLDKLPFNLFDCAVLAVLTLGILRGRKNGMSGELISLIKWIVVVAVCAFCYMPASKFVEDISPIGQFWAYLGAYAGLALLVLSIFGLFKHVLGGKLLGSDVFGRTEYYLGMAAGLVRFCCGLIVVLAMLNARLYTAADVQASERFQKEAYGSNFFPSMQSVQDSVFNRSMVGPLIKNHLSFLLIKPVHPEKHQLHQQEWAAP